MPEYALSKSNYLSGLQCERRLWLETHRPGEAVVTSDAQQHIFRMGGAVVEAAQKLFPGGKLVSAPASEHWLAVERTRELIADRSVPAIFEAAFEFEGVRVRVDVLERIDGEALGFGVRDVKSSTCLKSAQYIPDLAIQKWVLEHCGLSVVSTELVHLDADFVRGDGDIEWSTLFRRVELIDRLGSEAMKNVDAYVEEMRETLTLPAPPEREQGDFCKRPEPCPFWNWCTASKPGRWFIEQGGANEERKAIMLGVTETQEPWVSESLEEDLDALQAPFWALGFQAIGASIPLVEGTRPYQPVPFQWSLHRLFEDGTLRHSQFLATGRKDPREEVASALVRELEEDSSPIVVYSGYAKRRLKEMAAVLPELESSLLAIVDRLVDLLPIVRDNVYHPDFLGSYSIQYVAPALSPSLTYTGLVSVSNGTTATDAFARLVRRELSPVEEVEVRDAMAEYSERDTQALIDVYRSLRELAGAHKPAPEEEEEGSA
jgi:hypothetical protein